MAISTRDSSGKLEVCSMKQNKKLTTASAPLYIERLNHFDCGSVTRVN